MNNGFEVKCAVADDTLYGFEIGGDVITADADTVFVVSDMASGKTKTYVGIRNVPDIYGLSSVANPVGYAYCEGTAAKLVYFTFCDRTRPAVSVRFPSAPLVGEYRIWETDLRGLKELTVPVEISLDSPTETVFFALFYDENGKYVGMGTAAATVDAETVFVIMPVQNNVAGAKTLKMLATDADFRPLSEAESYALSGGGGSSGGGYSPLPNPTPKDYYLKAVADVSFEGGGTGAAYITEAEPTADMTLPETSVFSATLRRESRGYSASFTYYVIFTPGTGSELAYPRIVSGTNATSVTRMDAAPQSSPASVVYRVTAWSGAAEADAPTVTVKGAFRNAGGGGSSGGGGGGGSSGGGGGGSSGGGSAPAMYYYLQTVADVASENGGTGAAYVAREMPVELPQTPAASPTVFLPQFAPQFVYYAVFTPAEGSEFVDANVTQGTASLEPMGAGLIASSPSSVAYRVFAFGSPSPNQPPAVITGTFRSGGGSSSGGRRFVVRGREFVRGRRLVVRRRFVRGYRHEPRGRNAYFERVQRIGQHQRRRGFSRQKRVPAPLHGSDILNSEKNRKSGEPGANPGRRIFRFPCHSGQSVSYGNSLVKFEKSRR